MYTNRQPRSLAVKQKFQVTDYNLAAVLTAGHFGAIPLQALGVNMNNMVAGNITVGTGQWNSWLGDFQQPPALPVLTDFYKDYMVKGVKVEVTFSVPKMMLDNATYNSQQMQIVLAPAEGDITATADDSNQWPDTLEKAFSWPGASVITLDAQTRSKKYSRYISLEKLVGEPRYPGQTTISNRQTTFPFNTVQAHLDDIGNSARLGAVCMYFTNNQRTVAFTYVPDMNVHLTFYISVFNAIKDVTF